MACYRKRPLIDLIGYKLRSSQVSVIPFLSIGRSEYIINTYSKQKAVAGRQVIETVLDGWTMHKKSTVAGKITSPS